MSHRLSNPSSSRPGVWITAYNAVSVLGGGLNELRAGLTEGRSGLSSRPTLPEGFADLPFAACVGVVPGSLDKAPSIAPFVDTRQLRMAWKTLQPILHDVKRTIEHFGPGRVAVVLGTSTGGILSTEQALLQWQKSGNLPLDYACQDGHAMDAVVRYLTTALGIEGPAFATSSACASGAKALASARRLIELGVVDAVLVGGIDTIARMTVHGFRSLGVLSEQNCRPFDESSFGMNVSEGGAWLLMQRSEAKPISSPRFSLVGVGESSDAHHMSAPDPTGKSQQRAMQAALLDAGLTPGAVGYVNAHGTGTRANDTAEENAIVELLGKVPASSTKGLIGHQLGAAGATEAVIAAEVLLGLPLSPLGSIKDSFDAGLGRPEFVMSNSFAFGGANISLVLAKQPAHTEVRSGSPELRARVVAASALSLDPRFDPISKVHAASDPIDAKRIGTDVLGARGRARASELTRLFAESVTALGVEADRLAQLPLIVGSALGQIQTSKNLIDLFLNNDASPLAFQGSVHNATAGILSIALGNQRPSSSIAAGRDTVFATLLEAVSYLDPETCPEVLVLIGDERPPDVLGIGDFESSTVALILAHERATGQGALLEIRPLSGANLVTIDAPSCLTEHTTGPALGLVQWLSSAPAGAEARILRPNVRSPWEVVVQKQAEDRSEVNVGNTHPGELLPHEPPLLLLSSVLSFDEKHISCQVDLTASRLFQSDEDQLKNEVDAIVATEWMAQAVGAYVGATKRASGLPPKVGFIIGARKVDFHVPKVNIESQVQVTVTPVWVDRFSGNFDCIVKDNSRQIVIAEGSLTVHEPES